MKANLVLIEWDDAHATASWHSSGDVLADHKPETALNVGWVLKSDKLGVTIFSSYFPDDMMLGQSTFIPLKMIKKVTVLKKARKRR